MTDTEQVMYDTLRTQILGYCIYAKMHILAE